jgi:hypothetical protein
MFALRQHADQSSVLEMREMNARCGRGNFRDECQLSARSRMSIEQAIQNACASGLSNCRGNPRRRLLGGKFDIHALIVDELLAPYHWHNFIHVETP